MHDSWLETEFASLYLEQLLRESILACGRTAPNPTVAALAFDSNNPQHWTAGATEPPGARHAEIVALDRYREAYGSAPDSLIVTLEPCSKSGRTPPCVDRILSMPELQYVYVGGLDPSLAGEGIRLLEQSGREVFVPGAAGRTDTSGSFSGGDAKTADHRIHPGRSRLPGLSSFLSGLRRLYGLFPASFAHRTQYGRPRLFLKAASDGDRIMGDKSRRISISGPAALHAGQLLRRAVDAVLVGPGTVLTDEPTLDWRPGGQNGAGPGHSMNLNSPDLDGSEKERTGPLVDSNSEAYHDASPAAISESVSPLAFDSNASGNAGSESRKESQNVAGSSPNSPSHYLQSADPFIEALLRYGDEAEMQNPHFDHQPRRIFLLPEGQMEKSQLDAFQAKQWQRFEQGGPEPVFWTLSRKHHPGDLPALKDPFFGSALMQSLAELGLNTVLIEGGAGLHRALETILQPDDRFYWLRRKENLMSVDFEKPVKLPHFLTDLPQLQLMDLGPDELVAFAGRA